MVSGVCIRTRGHGKMLQAENVCITLGGHSLSYVEVRGIEELSAPRS